MHGVSPNTMKLFSTCLALLTVASGLQAAQYDISLKTYNVADAPQGIASGDLDGDGYPDLVVTATNPERLEWWLNDAAGEYALGGSLLLPAGSDPRRVALTDLDGDGQLDAAVLLMGTGQMQIATGMAGGSFVLGANVATGNGPIDIAAADADGDQDNDLLVSNHDDDTVTLFFNDGAGNLNGLTLAAGDGPHGVAFGDFDGNGSLDFAAANELDMTISVFENLGQGLFGAWSTIQGSSHFFQLTSADLDNDQDDDLAAATTDNNQVAGAAVFLSDGLGGWSGQANMLAPIKGNWSIAHGDFDCDGDMDLSLGFTGSSNGGFVILENDGSGDFPVPQRLGWGNDVFDMTVGDFDNDGAPDLAYAAAATNKMFVALNKTCGIELDQEGTCDGWVDFTITGLTPNGPVIVMIGHDRGKFVVPQGKPCAGLTVALDGATLRVAGRANADANGNILATYWAGPSCCGQIMQIIDLTTCKVSNPDVL